jgi:plasmid stabilization system protein ParE
VSFVVRYSASARDDLTRLHEYLLDRATTVEDLDLAEQALGAIVGAVENLSRSPFIYRKAGADPFLRELLIPFGLSGYVALFEIEDASTVTILAVRHQLEDDYH